MTKTNSTNESINHRNESQSSDGRVIKNLGFGDFDPAAYNTTENDQRDKVQSKGLIADEGEVVELPTGI